jgi:uncharacterized protein YcbX
MQLVDIALFPLKSAAGFSVPAAEVEARGLKGDRRWMLVDPNGRCVTQREIPAMARLQADLAEEPGPAGLRLTFEGRSIRVPCPDMISARERVTIWNDTLLLPQARSGSEWLSEVFGRDLRLVYQPDDARRPVADAASEEDQVSLADGFPLLLVNTASVDALSYAAGFGLGVERFRPNLLIDGVPAWAEDGWATVRIGPVVLDLVKPCPRCTVTTVDQARGEATGDEPLATLRRTRMSADRRVPGVLFGWNAVPRSFGRLHIGDPVEVLETRAPWPLMPERLAAAV